MNGVYLEDGTPYEPVGNIPVWSSVMVAAAVIFGAFSYGVIGVVVSLLVSMAILKLSLDRKYGAAIAVFVVLMAVMLMGWVIAIAYAGGV